MCSNDTKDVQGSLWKTCLQEIFESTVIHSSHDTASIPLKDYLEELHCQYYDRMATIVSPVDIMY